MNNNPYTRHRFPAEIISHCVWLYNSFSPSVKKIRNNRRKFNDKWHLDEVRIVIKGVVHWLWRAVDSEGQVLDILIQKRRNKKAAKRLLKKLLKKQ